MSAHENVFGVGVKFDADGQPIERGIGNLTDRKKVTEVVVAEPAEVAVETVASADTATTPAIEPLVLEPLEVEDEFDENFY